MDETWRNELQEFLAIPSVSADPAHREDVKRAGEWVCEVDRPDKPARKRGAKSDQIDAARAARQALQEEHLAQPRQRGQREAIRVLKLGRQQAVDVHSRAVVQLKSLVVSAPEELRAQLRGLNAEQLVKTCARLRQNSRQSLEWTATVAAMRALARRAESAAKDVEAILNAHYLGRDIQLAEAAVLKLEKRTKL